MANDTLNGAKLIIEEMETELGSKTLPRRDRIYLKAGIYQLIHLSNLRADVDTLKKHDIFSWALNNPKWSLIILVVVFAIGQEIQFPSLIELIKSIFKSITSIEI